MASDTKLSLGGRSYALVLHRADTVRSREESVIEEELVCLDSASDENSNEEAEVQVIVDYT